MFALLLCCMGIPCQDPPLFVGRELTAGTQVISTTCGGVDKDYIIEVNGGGLVVEDFNADGRLDLVVIDGSTLERVRAGEPSLPTRLLLGDGVGGFSAAGDSWDLSGGRWAMGGTAGDVNGDGFCDLFLTEWGQNRLYLNDGGRGFVEATPPPVESSWSTSAAFLDYDRDGLLDLFVVNYLEFDLVAPRGPGEGCSWKGFDVMCGPEGMLGQHDQLLRGKGDGTFVDVSAQAGLRPELAGFGLGVMTLDYDDDGDTDLYVSNDSTPNHLWENQGDGTFREVGLRRGVSHDANGKEQAGMGIGCADVDGDGRADLFVTNFSGERNAFYRSSRVRSFRERSDVARLGGVSVQLLGWGTGLADFDLDGQMDLFVVNGHVYSQADRPGTDTSYAQRDQFFRNDGTGRFVEEPLSQIGPTVARAALAADWDNDGDLDIALIELGGPVLVLENTTEAGADHHWLEVRLASRGANRFAIGAKVTVEFEGGSKSAEVRTTAGFQAGAPAMVHFGLGAVQEIKALVVRWPSGWVQRVEGIEIDQRVVIEEGDE